LALHQSIGRTRLGHAGFPVGDFFFGERQADLPHHVRVEQVFGFDHRLLVTRDGGGSVISPLQEACVEAIEQAAEERDVILRR
jgi:hypothetical protein